MAMTTYTNPADVSSRQVAAFFSKKLLKTLIPVLRKVEFAQQGDLPENAGTKTVRYHRRRKPKEDDVVTLTEGVAISTFTEFDFESVDVALVQSGEAGKLSDVIRLTDIFDTLKHAIEGMGEDAALWFDGEVRRAWVTGYANIDNGHERWAGASAVSTDSSAEWTSLAGRATASALVSRDFLKGGATLLKTKNVPRINGSYICVIPPEMCHDLTDDDDWKDVSKYSAARQIFEGEVGMLDGVRYVEDTNPHIEATGGAYGTYAAAGTIFTAAMFGRDMYGAAKLAGTKSPWKPQVIINDKPDKSDPLNQFCTAGWKAFAAAKVLNTECGVLLRAKSSFLG